MTDDVAQRLAALERRLQAVEDELAIYRVSMNRWELERRAGAWLIARRLTRLLGHDEAAALFAEGLAEV